MTGTLPFVLLAAGAVALMAGWLLLRGTGRAWRVGRLLASAPELGLEEVVTLARSGELRYVRARGRISSDEEFPDERQRPLVYRRRRLLVRDGRSGWRTFDDDRVAVPFGVEDRQTFVAVDVDALGDGLVAIPREAEGTLADLPPEMAHLAPAGASPATPVMLRVEQVSAVEHAWVAGVPSIGPDGQPRLSAGLGRPLILTPLEPSAAMRVLAAGGRGRVVAAAFLLGSGLSLLVLGVVTALLGA